MSEVWLKKLNPDEVGQPYIDVRAHRAFWESVERIAQSKKAQINDVLLDGNLSAAREITKYGLENFQRNIDFFVKEYNLDLENKKA